MTRVLLVHHDVRARRSPRRRWPPTRAIRTGPARRRRCPSSPSLRSGPVLRSTMLPRLGRATRKSRTWCRGWRRGASPLEDAQKSIADFIIGSAAERGQKAKLLFAGLFDRLNRERTEVMNGIERCRAPSERPGRQDQVGRGERCTARRTPRRRISPKSTSSPRRSNGARESSRTGARPSASSAKSLSRSSSACLHYRARLSRRWNRARSRKVGAGFRTRSRSNRRPIRGAVLVSNPQAAAAHLPSRRCRPDTRPRWCSRSREHAWRRSTTSSRSAGSRTPASSRCLHRSPA